MNCDNRGVTLIELIVVIAIMAVLSGIFVPQYMRYLHKSKQKQDIHTARTIYEIINMAMIEYPEAQQTFDTYNYAKRSVSATVDGVRERNYNVYLLMVNEDKYKYWFYGTMDALLYKNEGNIGFYNFINSELGLDAIMKGKNPNFTAIRENTAIMPQNKIAPVAGDNVHKIDRWRIVKRVDNGQLEVWSACDFKDGQSGGGKPCYRVWPDPDDVYTK